MDIKEGETNGPEISVADARKDGVEIAQSAGVSSLSAPATKSHDCEAATSTTVDADTDQALSAKPDERDSSSERPASASSNPLKPASYVPPVKRFNAVNINKKFLEKTSSSTSTTTNHSLSSTSGKQAGPVARPSPQTVSSHSRLVTTKLTVTGPSSTPGPGWSRPTSVTPPVPASGGTSSSSGPLPGSANSPPSSQAPQSPAAGKVIHPQSRSALRSKADTSSAANKPAWGNIPHATLKAELGARSDFPTAAEAAKAIATKAHDDAKSAVTQEQAMAETADAFRGVHLDPNAHHWDEMEEDDNDFLGGVIEFGDGTQYTIQVNDSGAAAGQRDGEIDASAPGRPDVPVRKEDRFVDDFDRSWPRSRNSAHNGQPSDSSHFDDIHNARSSYSEAPSQLSTSPVSLRDGAQHRVLFNERSNRMEPYGFRTGGSSSSYGVQRRNDNEPQRAHPDGRHERDAPPHAGRQQVQVLQKPSRGPPSEYEHPQRGPYGYRDRREADLAEVGSSFSRSSDDRRSRRYSNTRSTTSNTSSHDRRNASREPSISRGMANGIAHQTGAGRQRSVDGRSEQGARTAWNSTSHEIEPPPLPFHGRARDMERQLPPHLQHVPFSPLPSPLPVSTPTMQHKEVVQPHPPLQPSPPSEAAPASSSGLQSTVPTVNNSITETPAPTPADVEALRKAFLHERAEQAKRRRQQEEEERAKAQERARQKALELEGKLSAASRPSRETPQLCGEQAAKSSTARGRPSEADVLNVIEDAVKSAKTLPRDGSREPPTQQSSVTDKTASDGRISEGQVGINTASAPIRRSSQPAISDVTESWRSTAKPPAPVPKAATQPKASQGHSREDVLPAVQAFDVHAGEDLEVVDFNDLSRLASETECQAPKQPTGDEYDKVSQFTSGRPVASDFFTAGRHASGQATALETETWRRPEASHSVVSVQAGMPDEVKHMSVANDGDTAPTANTLSAQALLSPLDIHNGFTHSNLIGPAANLRHPRPPLAYREAPMSALDDTMSRIKGALVGMQSTLAVREEGKDEITTAPTCGQGQRVSPPNRFPPARESRWLPPALRPPIIPRPPSSEPFDVTRPELAQPHEGDIVVRPPKTSRKVEPLPRRQINLNKSSASPVRWEILSFDPPVEGMTKRSLLVNDVLFGKYPGPKHRPRYRVVLPKPKRVPRLVPHVDSSVSQPTVKLNPSGISSTPAGARSPVGGAFGKASKADQGNWRALQTSSQPGAGEQVTQLCHGGLDVTSRSPPPEPSKAPLQREQLPASPPTSKTATTAAKSKVPHGMPVGADVAFYRDGRMETEVASSTATVTFTVTSELDVAPGTTAGVDIRASPAVSNQLALETTARGPGSGDGDSGGISTSTTAALSDQLVGVKISTSGATRSPETSLLLDVDKNALHPSSSKLLSDYRPSTPPSQASVSTSIWGKSPSRAPDREHLKAVWQQASDKDSIPTTNSLKEIADDLTTVPFSIHEVKLEDGGTPPPPAAPPSRMSASEVTRAFQTVPTASGATKPIGAGPFSPVLGPPQHLPTGSRPPATVFTPPGSGARPHYMGYPSPLASHTPSPTLLYPQMPPHFLQNQMHGSPSSPYGQPVWMPMGAHLSQQSPQMARAQPASSYGAPHMQYHAVPAQNGIFPPPPANHQGSQTTPPSYTGAPHARISIVSPVLPQATTTPSHVPMYGASPMLMHVPPSAGTPQTQPYPGAVGAARGAMPAQQPVDPRQMRGLMPPAAPGVRYPSQAPAYTHVNPQAFARPTW